MAVESAAVLAPPFDSWLPVLGCGIALTLGFWLLFRWLGAIVDAVPQEDRAWFDPPPLYWRLLGFAGHAVGVWIGRWLPPMARRRCVDRLRQAGLEHALTVDQFVAGQAIGAALALGLLAVVTAGLESLPLAVWLGTAVVGAMLPASWLRDRIDRRARAIAKVLPFYLDVITLAIEAGANMTGALQHAVDKGPQGPMAEELHRVLRDVRAGRTRADALRMMAERLRMPAISNWIAAVLAAERQGSSLGPILRAQAEQRRTERFLRAEAQALKAPVKMLFPLMTCIFPCTFIVVFFPIAVRIIEDGVLG
ncbi:MAG: type II secretion system F family protein [Lautropia sp.]